MITKKSLTWFGILLACGIMVACGSNRDSDSSIVGGGDVLASAQVLGIANCQNCHTQIVSEWVNSLGTSGHGNPNNYPDSGFFDHEPITDCTICHDSTGDGTLLGDNFGVFPNRPVVSCESCHGGGQFHNGVGPLPYPDPDPYRCAECHDAHGSDLGTKILNSRHNAGGHDTRARCQRCHTTEGSLTFSGVTGDRSIISAGLGSVDPLLNVSAPTCSACHSSHDGALRADSFIALDAVSGGGNWDPNLSGTPDQFDFCTSCHNLFANDGTTIIASGTSTVYNTPTLAFYHDDDWYRIIATTHYDNPSTGFQTDGDNDGTNDRNVLVEGYVIRANSANPCFDCHGHELITNTRQDEDPPRPSTIHTDWAQSGHAGGLLSAKYAKEADIIAGNVTGVGHESVEEVDEIMMAGASDDTSGGGWTHYNWDSSGLGSCQRCHTATGAMNFMDDPATYNSALNDFSHLYNWTDDPTAGSPQNELLYCWACHTNAGQGELRNPGAITEEYDDLVIVSYPDIDGSNVCMSCHLGRETGDVIKVNTDVVGDGLSFINSHYLTAGAQLFAESGYEYAGVNYNNVDSFEHDLIGTEGYPGDHGPCVSCHMHSEESHLFQPVGKNESTGEITAITSTVCIECHAGAYALSPAILMEEEHEYSAALDVLTAALASKGMFFANAYPYFFNDTNTNQILDPDEIDRTNPFVSWGSVYNSTLWKDTMGAAFNANLLIHDPGGYAHNRFYIKALIWDSIDFIDDSILNNSVPATITALTSDPDSLDTTIDPETAAAAQAYLGSSRPGDADRL